ncbi:PKD domain-containing protein [Streptomyces sp. NPDC051366]|uniref:PKD domain-containing protein n=1 Tax=Streptomyces sp. NPDC051366 TaxID=3365652 RepID=UPI0037B36083
MSESLCTLIALRSDRVQKRKKWGAGAQSPTRNVRCPDGGGSRTHPGHGLGGGRPVRDRRARPGGARKTALKTYHSPADRTVRTTLPAGGNKASAAQAQSAAGNPQLALDIAGSTHTALGLEIKSTITSEDVPLDVTIDWGDGKTDRVTTKGSGERWDKHTYTEVGEYRVKVTVIDAANGVQAVNELMHLTQGTEFNPYAPTRLLDTRNGTGTKAGQVAGRGKTRVKVTGVGGIPAGGSGVPSGVEAVALNVTATNTAAPGHITVWKGDDTGIPGTSNLNYAAGHQPELDRGQDRREPGTGERR